MEKNVAFSPCKVPRTQTTNPNKKKVNRMMLPRLKAMDFAFDSSLVCRFSMNFGKEDPLNPPPLIFNLVSFVLMEQTEELSDLKEEIDATNLAVINKLFALSGLNKQAIIGQAKQFTFVQIVFVGVLFHYFDPP